MKISEYNQMMKYLTRPKVRDVDFGLRNTNVESLVPDKTNNSPAGVELPEVIEKYKKPKKTPLANNYSIEKTGLTPTTIKARPKIMPDPTSPSGFTGMTPADDKLLRYVEGVKNNDPKTLKAIDDYSDQLHFDNVLGQFKKGNKVGALSDFKNDEKLFEPILDRLKVKGKTAPVPFKRTQLDKVLDFNLAENIKEISKGMAEYQQLIKNKEGIEQEQQTPRPARAREGGLDMEFTKEKLDEKQILKDL